MIRVQILLALLVVTVAAHADSFGRFGYRPLADLPGFAVNPAGIKVAGGPALLLRTPTKRFVVVQTGATAQTVSLDGGTNLPSEMRFSLIGDSLDLYFDDGIELDLTQTEPPFLSWKDGSVGPNVPTPPEPWLLLSSSANQAPVVLGFSGRKASFSVSGGPGRWRVVCADYVGWLRLMLPFGDRTFATPDASSLGRVSNLASAESDHWSAMTPKVKRLALTADDQGVDAEWTFDGPGAVIPPCVILAQLGGYPLSIRSSYHEATGSATLGPFLLVDGNALKIHFPIRRVYPGRALGIGQATESPPSSASPFDIPSLVDLALQSLLAHRDSSLAKLADDTSAHYLEDATYTTEPFTRQQLPFDATGTGADLAAVHAFLSQAESDAVDSSDPNSLLESVGFFRDWWTWEVPAADPAVAIRATAFGALAGALSQSPSGRLLGATLEAGLAAERGRSMWRARFSDTTAGETSHAAPLPQPLEGLRAGFFALKGAAPSPYFTLLQSPLRVGIGGALQLQDAAGEFQLEWTAEDAKPSVVTFLNPAPAGFSPIVNLKRVTLAPSSTCLSLYYVPNKPGDCALSIKLSPGSPPIPLQVAPPRYDG